GGGPRGMAAVVERSAGAGGRGLVVRPDVDQVDLAPAVVPVAVVVVVHDRVVHDRARGRLAGDSRVADAGRSGLVVERRLVHGLVGAVLRLRPLDRAID